MITIKKDYFNDFEMADEVINADYFSKFEYDTLKKGKKALNIEKNEHNQL